MPTSVHDVSRYPPICLDTLTAIVTHKNVVNMSRRPPEHESVKAYDGQFLQKLLEKKIANAQVIVVSNRQLFHHTLHSGLVRLVQPASGLITALEPIVRACAGTWIAHGSGANDRDFVDSQDRCPAPIGNGAYTLR